MASYQRMTIIGNLGSDPEFRYLTDGTPLTSFTVAVNERRRATTTTGAPDGEETEERVQWFRVFCQGRLAEEAQQSLVKGASVLVRGSLHVREYTTREGATRCAVELTAREVLGLSDPTHATASDSEEGGLKDGL